MMADSPSQSGALLSMRSFPRFKKDRWEEFHDIVTPELPYRIAWHIAEPCSTEGGGPSLTSDGANQRDMKVGAFDNPLPADWGARPLCGERLLWAYPNDIGPLAVGHVLLDICPAPRCLSRKVHLQREEAEGNFWEQGALHDNAFGKEPVRDIGTVEAKEQCLRANVADIHEGNLSGSSGGEAQNEEQQREANDSTCRIVHGNQDEKRNVAPGVEPLTEGCSPLPAGTRERGDCASLMGEGPHKRDFSCPGSPSEQSSIGEEKDVIDGPAPDRQAPDRRAPDRRASDRRATKNYEAVSSVRYVVTVGEYLDIPLPPPPKQWQAKDVLSAMDAFIAAEGLWDSTGCFHRAGVYDMAQGKLLKRAEDIGRHNCVDRLAGWSVLEKIPLTDKVLLVSARMTSSLCAKAIRAGFPVVVSRSAVTTAAIAMAKEAQVTLLGFARTREQRFTVFNQGKCAICHEKE